MSKLHDYRTLINKRNNTSITSPKYNALDDMIVETYGSVASITTNSHSTDTLKELQQLLRVSHNINYCDILEELIVEKFGAKALIVVKPTQSPIGNVVRMTAELNEVKAIQAEVQAEIDKTIAMEQKLDEQIKQYKLKAEADKLEQEELERQVAVTEEKLIIVEKLARLEKKYTAITEDRNKLQADLRVSQNLERVFTQQQRTALLIRSGGKCQQCGDNVTISTFEADHIIPYSKGGSTTLDNGQCLCRHCNRSKGTK